MTVRLHRPLSGRATGATGVHTAGAPGQRAALRVTALAAGILACMPVALASGAAAQRYGAWELTCGGGATGQGQAAQQASQQSCRLTQRQSAPASDTTLFAITVLPAATAETGNKPAGARAKGDDKRLIGIISTPAGGYLAPGMILQVDRESPFRLLYETCNAGGCHAGFALESRVLAALLRGKLARVRIWTSRNAPVDVKVALDGFAAARAALLRGLKASSATKAPAGPGGDAP